MTCPLCGADSSFAFSVGDRNRRLSDELFDYERCERCATLFLANVPEDLGRYYPSEYYQLPSAEQLERVRRAEAFKLDLLGVPPAGRLIEVGPGAGGFAYSARRAGFDVTGIEMDARASDHVREVAGVDVVTSATPHEALAQLPPSRVIALWHVLEHLPDPWACVAAAAENLEPGGRLVIAVPNPESLQMRVLKRDWAHIDAPRHLFLIPSRTLLAQAERHGLECVRLTTRDRGGIYWNRFGWQYALMRPGASRARVVAATAFGVAATLAAAPLELRPLRGAAYTAVLRKR
jgi:2-polyprenyl-3-methyl-5-hydroxy-6-metoxy-1,4-benzoquinol methylase